MALISWIPWLAMILFAAMFHSAVPRTLPVAVVDDSRGPVSRELIRALDAAPALDVCSHPLDLHQAWPLVRAMQVDAVIHIPADTDDQIQRGQPATVFAFYNAAYAYFEEHKESFPLSRSIVQFRGVTVNKEDAAEAERLFNSGKDEDFDELMKIVLASELPFHDKDSAWYSIEAMTGYFPQLNEGNYLNQLLNRRRVKMESDSIVTLLRIITLKQKGSEAPYDFVKPTIKNLLLNKRKLNLLSDLQNELYKEAINNNQIKINEK